MSQLNNFHHLGLCQTYVIRPADGKETAAAWKTAIESTSTPIVLVLTRQNLQRMKNTKLIGNEGVQNEAYVISPAKEEIADASGSEVGVALM
jgi:transketolase